MNENLRIIAEFVDRASAGLQRAGESMNNFTQGVRNSAAAQAASTTATRAATAATAASAAPLAAAATAFGGLIAGIGAAALAMTGFANAVREADRLDDLAEKTGTTAANLRDLGFAAGLSGSSLDGVIGAMSKLGKAADMSDEAASKQAQTFAQLGVSATDANGKLKNSEQLFMELADAFQGIEDGPEKSAAAFRLFGGEAKNLMPLLNSGSEGIAALKAESAALAGVAPDAFNAFAASSATLFDGLDKVGVVANGLFAQLGNALLPVINVMIEAFLNSAKEGGMVRLMINGLVEAFKFLIPYVKAGAEIFSGFISTVQIAGKSIGAVMAAISTIASGGGIAGLKQVWRDYKSDVQDVAQGHVDFTSKLNATGTAASAAAPQIDKPKRSIQSLRKEATATVWELDKLLKTLKDYTPDYYLGNDPTLAAHAKDLQLADEAAKRDIRNGMSVAAARKKQAEAEEQAEKNAAIRRQVAAENRADELRDLNVERQYELDLMAYEVTLTGKTAAERERLLQAYKDERDVRKEIAATFKAGDSEEVGKMLRLTNERAAALKVAAEDARLTNEIFDQTLTSAQEAFTRRIQMAVQMYEQGKISLADFTKYQQEQYDALLGKTEQTAEKSATFWEEAAKGMQDAMQTFFYDFMQGNMTSLVDDFQKMISKMVAQALAARLGQALFGADFAKTGSVSGGLLGSFFGGFRAGGGPVSAGKAYVVGEKRPELFVPNTSGTILPSADIASSNGVTVHMSINATDPQSFLAQMNNVKREVASMMQDTQRKYNLGVR